MSVLVHRKDLSKFQFSPLEKNGSGTSMSALSIHRLKKLAAVPLNPPIAGNIAGALFRGEFKAARWMAAQTHDLGAEKIVSRKYRFLWLCNPKAASRSAIAALRCADPDAELIHAKSVSNIYEMYPEVQDYYSFAFIRHPFGRALSFYAEMRFFRERFEGKGRCLKERRHQYYSDMFPRLTEVDNFGGYCEWLNTTQASDMLAERHFLSQHIQIRLPDGRLPDFIGTLENFEDDFERVAAALRMPAPKPPMLNTMAGWQPPASAVKAARADMSACLTERNRALLAKRYAVDLDLYRSVSANPQTRDQRALDKAQAK